MNRNEFLRILRESLEMSLEKDALNEQLDYYDKYISDEIKKGKTEKEVIAELGDPRLIAKTIKTVSKPNDVKGHSDDYSNNDDDNSNSNRGRYSNDNFGSANSNSQRNYRTYVDTTGIGCLLVGLVVFIMFMFILRLFGSMAYGLGNLAFSGPIGFLIVMGLLYFFFGGRRGR